MAEQVQAPIAVTTGAYTNINAAAFAHYVEIAEDGAVAPAGLRVKWPNGNVTTYTPSQQPIKIGTPEARTWVGAPADAAIGRAATLYCQIESVAATGSVRVSEWN